MLSERAHKWFKCEPDWLINVALESFIAGALVGLLLVREWYAPHEFDHFSAEWVDEETSFHFTHPSWSFSHPTADSEADCLKRFIAERDQYIRDMEAIATNRGLVPAPEKRSTWHVHAFVQYQVLNRTKQEVADQLAAKEYHPVTVSAVEKQRRKIAIAAGMTLRMERDRRTRRPTEGSVVFERKAFKRPR